MIGITEVNFALASLCLQPNSTNEFITDGSGGSGFDMPDKDCPNCGHKLSKTGRDILLKPSLVSMGIRYLISI